MSRSERIQIETDYIMNIITLSWFVWIGVLTLLKILFMIFPIYVKEIVFMYYVLTFAFLMWYISIFSIMCTTILIDLFY